MTSECLCWLCGLVRATYFICLPFPFLLFNLSGGRHIGRFSTIKLEPNHRRRGRTINWQDLYFPIGCGKVKDGVPANIPLMRQTDGSFIPVSVLFASRPG